jgi:hypothetical protein
MIWGDSFASWQNWTHPHLQTSKHPSGHGLRYYSTIAHETLLLSFPEFSATDSFFKETVSLLHLEHKEEPVILMSTGKIYRSIVSSKETIVVEVLVDLLEETQMQSHQQTSSNITIQVLSFYQLCMELDPYYWQI